MNNLSHHPIDSRLLSAKEREKLRPISTLEICEKAKEVGVLHSPCTIFLHHALNHSLAVDDLLHMLLEAGQCNTLHPQTGASCYIHSPDMLCAWCEQRQYVKSILGDDYFNE